MELEDSFSENDKYLIREYEKHGTDDFLLAELGEKQFVVPYKYTIGAHTPKTAQQRFLTALTDFEGREAGKYRRAGEPVWSVEYNGRDYVVPYGTGEQISPESLAQDLEGKAAAKYNTIVNSARALEAFGAAPDMTDFSSVAADRYAAQLAEFGTTAVLDEKTPERLKIIGFLQKMGEKSATKFKTTTGKILRAIGRKIIEAEKEAARKYVPSGYKTAALAALIGAGSLTGYFALRSGGEDEKGKGAQTEISVDNKAAEYVDFMGKTHIDHYGNVARMNELRGDITAILIAVEGFADKAFLDGGGTPTIGIGTTFYLDEKGKETPVQLGETITLEEAMVQKWRYIEKKMLPIYAKTVGRSCSDGDIMGGIGAGFCWGVNGFRKSEYFKSIQNDEDTESKVRKISGYRKQKGLLKRGYLLANVQAGIWKGEDMLNMPIFMYKDKGYLNCGIYRLDLHELLPCIQDKNGQYLKDEDGNNIPKVEKDGFCQAFYTDSAAAICDTMAMRAQRGKQDYVTVKDFMPEDMLKDMLPRNAFMAALAERLTAEKLPGQGAMRLAQEKGGR